MLTGVADLVVARSWVGGLGSPDLSEVNADRAAGRYSGHTQSDGRAVPGIIVEVSWVASSVQKPASACAQLCRSRCGGELCSARWKLLVVCVDPTAWRWARWTQLDPDRTRVDDHPIVVGLNSFPVIDDADVAASSRELAMLSAMAHYAVPEVLEALAAAITTDFGARPYV